jgi:putative N6-adenine-specific DNA methylase
MCGSGTFVIEAAEIAAGLKPGRSRHFAFELLATFDAEAWQRMREAPAAVAPPVRFYGSDIDAGAIRMSRANAKRAGVADLTEFREIAIVDVTAPEGPAGIVIINPPFGDRIGEKGRVKSLYRTLGQTLLTRFSGWRVGLVTTEIALAEATGLPFTLDAAPVLHGGLRVNLFRTAPLP